VFTRAMVAPPDRNLIDAFVQGGITYKAPFDGRDNDTVGFAASWTHISRKASRLDADTVAYTGQTILVRHTETQLEGSYQAQISPWFQLQPDVQYVFNPGGGLQNSRNGRRVGDALVLDMRATVTF